MACSTGSCRCRSAAALVATLNVSGYKRCKRWAPSASPAWAALGAEAEPTGPSTSVLSSGPIDAAGNVHITVSFDHRVVDGANMARCLTEMEQALHGPTLNELVSLRRHQGGSQWGDADSVNPVDYAESHDC